MSGEALERLLEVQDHDTAIDQLEHRRRALPARARLGEAGGRLAALEARIEEVFARRSAIGERQRVLEAEVAHAEQRIGEIDRRMYSGEVKASRELQAMAAEVDALKARRSTLEDEILEIMEQCEPIDAELAQLGEERSGLLAEMAGFEADIAAGEAEIDALVAEQASVRAEAASAVPAELLSTYERIRRKLGGVGAARLVGSSCSGCHLALPAVEVERIRRQGPGSVVFCEQCGRILVR